VDTGSREENASKRQTGAHFPNFVLDRGAHFHELRKVMGTRKQIDTGAAFPFEEFAAFAAGTSNGRH
jgi:hypothetical protein